MSAFGGKADIYDRLPMSANDPKRTLKDKLSSRWCYQPTRERLSGS